MDIDPSELVADAILYVVFLFSTTVHEAAHALAALIGGDRTAYHGGQVSLSPLPHIRREPLGMVLLPLVGLLLTGFPIGYASAPYNRDWAATYPRRAALMALAGPAANLLLVIVAGGLIRLGIGLEVLEPPAFLSFTSIVDAGPESFWPGVAAVLSVVFSINLVMAVFNLLPLPPLDGSAAVNLFLGERARLGYQRLIDTGIVQIVGLLLAWRFFGTLFAPVFRFALRVLYPEVG
ncbi:MAG: site-2 protease family protein [Bauldia sp.]